MTTVSKGASWFMASNKQEAVTAWGGGCPAALTSDLCLCLFSISQSLKSKFFSSFLSFQLFKGLWKRFYLTQRHFGSDQTTERLVWKKQQLLRAWGGGRLCGGSVSSFGFPASSESESKGWARLFKRSSSFQASPGGRGFREWQERSDHRDKLRSCCSKINTEDIKEGPPREKRSLSWSRPTSLQDSSSDLRTTHYFRIHSVRSLQMLQQIFTPQKKKETLSQQSHPLASFSPHF